MSWMSLAPPIRHIQVSRTWHSHPMVRPNGHCAASVDAQATREALEVRMHARERMIQERFATQTCSECGWPYSPRGVLVLARRRSAWMVLVTCNQCHRRGIFVVSFPAPPPLPDGTSPKQESVALDGGQSTRLDQESSPPSPPISSADVAQIREFLANFDGDFRRAFGGPPPAPPSIG